MDAMGEPGESLVEYGTFSADAVAVVIDLMCFDHALSLGEDYDKEENEMRVSAREEERRQARNRRRREKRRTQKAVAIAAAADTLLQPLA